MGQKTATAIRVRPSIDSELVLGVLGIGYLYGITSERRRVEKTRLAPDPATFWKKRHGTLSESRLFRRIGRQRVEAGTVERKHLSVNDGFEEANAAKQSRIRCVDTARAHSSLR